MAVDDKTLIEKAKAVRQNAHAPYSGYFVGAAILDESGRVYVGCNVENAAYPEGICAETNAIGSMIADGGKKIVRIAAVGGLGELEACTPCGACRQRISEFADETTEILLLDEDGKTIRRSMCDLLPASFSLRD